MSPREYEPLTEYDPHDMLFGARDDDHDDDRDDDHGDGLGAGRPRPYRETRADRRRAERDEHDEHHHRRRSRRGWLITGFTLLVVIAVAVVAVPRVISYFRTDDWSGSGANYPTVTVTVESGQTSADIAATLAKAGVVASADAFTQAASNNSDSQNIQPGRYSLHQHQSGSSALQAILDPSSRQTSGDLTVIEGANVLDVQKRLTAILGANAKPDIAQALAKPVDLGLPVTYDKGKTVPSSIEGFLYPATYVLDPGGNAQQALQKMVARFIEADRSSGFAGAADKLGITPYQALTVASIVQAEAKFSDDMPKVAEVIYNRLKAGKALQIDATTKYGCEIANEAKCSYATFPSPYNSYLHDSLPPTPIDNPGAQAMDAAVHPATGALLYYVNGDKDGHLYFTSNESDFAKAAEKCRANNWGCA